MDRSEWVLVPRDPTREMIEAGVMFGNSPNKATIIYQSMVNAAPPPPSESESAKAFQDMLDTGTGFMLDGKRVAPERVRVVTPPPAAPERALPTERRMAAVELLLAQGYRWHEGKWTPPAEQASGDDPIDADNNAEYIEGCADRLERFGHRVTAGALRAIAAEYRALSQRPVVDEAMVRDILPDGWTQDCQGKQDYDAGLVALSCRYYPPRYSENGSHSASAALVYGDGVREIARKEFEASTEGGVKVLVEEWAQQQVSALTAALAPQQQGGAE